MKKAVFLFTLLFLITCTSCAAGGHDGFLTLREEFLVRGENVQGYEVDEIEEYDGMEYFTVRVCLNTDDAISVDDYVWFEANVMYFDNEEDADAAYQRNLSTGLGGTCLREGNTLIYWMTGDPFADLYKDVFTNVFG